MSCRVGLVYLAVRVRVPVSAVESPGQKPGPLNCTVEPSSPKGDKKKTGDCLKEKLELVLSLRAED